MKIHSENNNSAVLSECSYSLFFCPRELGAAACRRRSGESEAAGETGFCKAPFAVSPDVEAAIKDLYVFFCDIIVVNAYALVEGLLIVVADYK